LDGWKPSEKCYRCEDLTVTFEDGMKFGCARLEGKPLVVPYLLVQLWDRNKDAIRAEKPECGDVSPPPDAPKAFEVKAKPPRAWPMNYGNDEGYCPECGSGHLKPIEKYYEFKYTLYQVLKCDRCGYEEGELISRIPRRYGHGPKEEGQTA